MAARGVQRQAKDLPNKICPKCSGRISDKFSRGFCKFCRKYENHKFCEQCEYFEQCEFCENSTAAYYRPEEKYTTSEVSKADRHNKAVWILGIVIVIFVGCIVVKFIEPQSNRIDIENLKKNYPSQSDNTWYHILSAVDAEFPTVKSLTFLHGKDKKTSNCLVKELVSLYTQNKEIEKEKISFGPVGSAVEDYGQVLEFYLPLVRKNRILVTNLNKVPASIARIFHSLCDEVSSDIKPSLFIFTLQYESSKEKLRPIEKATAFLKAAWAELPESELFPLLSRVVKNVVDVAPEQKVDCSSGSW